MKRSENFDVIIIGGSYAGLSAAMALGRSMRPTLVIDGGEPCNRQTPHSHNFLTQDGATPQEITEAARDQVARYETVHLQHDLVIGASVAGQGFQVQTQSGETYEASKLIFATGIRDLLPPIPGFAECWGISLIHCPYCHGYEFRKEKTGIIANGERAYHLASLVHNLTSDLTLLTPGAPELTDVQLQKLHHHGIDIDTREIVELIHTEGRIDHVRFTDGTTREFTAIYAAVPFEQQTSLPVDLGCELTEAGYLKVDGLNQTTVPGIFACGDNMSPMRSVANAVASGNFTGAVVNRVLTEERF